MFSPIKNPVFNRELSDLINEMSKTVKAMKNQSEAFSGIADSLFLLIENEAPSYSQYFLRIKEIYNKLSNIYANGANLIDRSLEDFRDVNARFVVVKRYEDQRNSTKSKYVESFNAFNSAAKQLSEEKPETKKNYEKALKNRSDWAQKLMEDDKKLVEYRKKFNAFAMRRIKSGWASYGNALSNIYVLESAAFNELTKLYKSIKDHVNDPDKIFSRLRCITQTKDEEIESIMPTVELQATDDL